MMLCVQGQQREQLVMMLCEEEQQREQLVVMMLCKQEQNLVARRELAQQWL